MRCPLLIFVVQVRENIGAFIQAIVKRLETEEQKLPKLLFAFHTLFRYGIPVTSTFVAEAEKCLQLIEFRDKYNELRGKR